MSIEQTRTCKKCQRENLQDAKFCTQCGADLAAPSRRPLLIAAGLTALPFIITPILIVVDSVVNDTLAGTQGFGVLFDMMAITFLMAVYLGVGAIIGAVIRRKNRSVARGVFLGLGVGLLLGVASCTASFVLTGT